jgi:hypothetical protein
MTLAQAVGNNTAQRALSGASAVAVGGAAAFVAAPLPADLKPLLALELADQLAYMGQSVRARGIIRDIQTTPNPTPALTSALLRSEVTVSAWGLSSASADKARKLMEGVRSGIAGLRDPADKVRAANSAAIAVAAQSRTPEQTAQAFLVQAAEAAKQISDPTQKQLATDDLLVASGHVLLSGVGAAARLGNFERANDLMARLQNSAKQAQSATAAAQLHAMLYQGLGITSADASSTQALETAVAQALKAASLAEKAVAIQAVGDITGIAAVPGLLKALQTIEPSLASAAGAARLQALGAVSAAYASLGDEAKAEAIRSQIATTPGTQPAEQQLEMARALLRADLALARYQQKTGAYAQSENTVMRAASYLFAKGK